MPWGQKAAFTTGGFVVGFMRTKMVPAFRFVVMHSFTRAIFGAQRMTQYPSTLYIIHCVKTSICTSSKVKFLHRQHDTTPGVFHDSVLRHGTHQILVMPADKKPTKTEAPYVLNSAL